MEKFTLLAKIYTAAGTDGMDKFHLWIYPASYKKCSGISSRAVNGRRLSAFVQISGLFQIYITYICTIFKMSI